MQGTKSHKLHDELCQAVTICKLFPVMVDLFCSVGSCVASKTHNSHHSQQTMTRRVEILFCNDLHDVAGASSSTSAGNDTWK